MVAGGPGPPTLTVVQFWGAGSALSTFAVSPGSAVCESVLSQSMPVSATPSWALMVSAPLSPSKVSAPPPPVSVSAPPPPSNRSAAPEPVMVSEKGLPVTRSIPDPTWSRKVPLSSFVRFPSFALPSFIVTVTASEWSASL